MLATAPSPYSALEEATPDSVLGAEPDEPASQRAQVLAQLGVDRWHRLGFRGKGMRIAVLDSGFRGYRAHLGHSLPANVTVRSFRADGNLEAHDSQHGILCGEVLHALAPEAEMLFANWDPSRPDRFLAAALWARQQGARVLSCSLIMPSWSDGEGGGPVNEALARIIAPGDGTGDVLFFASAGNTAQRHWSGRFQDAGNRLHAWAAGLVDNRVLPWGRERVSVEMCWRPGANYELEVYEAGSGQLLARAQGRVGLKGNTKRCCAVVRFLPRPGQAYQVRVRHLRGKPGNFHLVVLGGRLGVSKARGSISCPADGPGVIAVGAVDARGRRVCYSSCGPNSRRPKPDFVARVPFPSMWRNRPFSGTSAAAPQAAALAALWWSRYPGWTAEQVRTAMQKAAVDLGPAGHDYETGYGLIRLP
jgi:subtilisin family serine protease